ncbi:MAG: hypothetical protein QM500_06585 [Methylococcales bacterium]
MKIKASILVCFVFLFILSGCAGTHSFPNRVLAGETVTIGAGWKHDFSRNNVTVRFIPEIGPEVVYMPGDPAVRAILNLYPDPLSGMVISQQIAANINAGSKSHGDVINWNYTGNDNDWWQSTVFVDVPASLSVGAAEVEITNQVGDKATSLIEVIGSGGGPDAFIAEGLGDVTSFYFNSLERIDHYVITINSATIPAAIQLELAATNFSGYVTQGRGEAASLNWAKNGDMYTIILTPTTEASVTKMQDFKVYIAVTGGVAGMANLSLVGAVQAFDNDGEPIDGVAASILLERGVAGLIDL